jgi:tetratricopeptide (TPR) repeat protein
MKYRILLLATFGIVAFALAADADSVLVRGREKAVVGDLKIEDAKGVIINTTKDKKKVDELIPAADVIDIAYDDIKPAELRLAGGAYKIARDADKEAGDASDPAKRKVALSAAITAYNKTLTDMQAHKSAKRTLEYRVAVLMVKQAVNDSLPTDKALTKLQAFKTAYPNSWQIVHVMPMIAQLQLDAKDYKGAEQTFQEMSEMDALPPDVRTAAELEVVQVNVRAGNIAQAQKKLDVLEVKAKGNPAFASRVKMARAEVLVGQKKNDEAVPILQQVVKENNDKQIKAMAHNTLGECYFKATRYNEALWEFLWVDAVFNQDRGQHARALYYLWKCFEQLNNAERAQECREMLLNDRQFTGTEYQIRAKSEVK